MAKFFNTSGFCNPEKHYMVGPFRNLFGDVYKLIESEQYFLLHAPRQTGKTTFLHAVAKRLNSEGKYIALTCSLESAGYPGNTVEAANREIIKALAEAAEYSLPIAERPPAIDYYMGSTPLVKEYLANWSKSQSKPIVLLLDEVDALFDNVMVSILRQLRDGFQMRPTHFPASIALVGLRDLRDYKDRIKVEDKSVVSGGSPFNINTKSFFLPIFSREEVMELLQQHTDETGQVFSEEVFEKIYQYSNGQPWLTNALANEIVREMLKDDFKKTITPEMVDIAKETLIAKRQTHLYNLTDKLREPRIKKIAMTIISGESLFFDDYDESLRYALDLGIIRLVDGEIQFSNPIYREIITRVMNLSLQHSMTGDDIYKTFWYLDAHGNLDMDKLLKEFVKFYRRHSESWLKRYEYEEAGHQLLLMAFLQRIVNGGGRVEREMAAGRGRTDLEVHWKEQVFILELKLLHDSQTLEDGLVQLSRYLDRAGQEQGYLILFELKPSEAVPWEQRIFWKKRRFKGKKITLVGM